MGPGEWDVMSATSPAFAMFDESVAHLERATEAAVIVSESNLGVYHTGRQNRALFLLAKLIAHDMSVLAILDCCRRSLPGTALLDHFSIASLARTIIDASLMTMYISHPDLQRDEWNLRRYVLYLHDLTNRKRFLTSIQSADEAFLSSYPRQKAAIIEKIRHFAKSLHIGAKVTDDLIKGQKVFVDGARGAVREAGWDVKHFDYVQSYFSAYVHSHPVSFMRAEEHQISFSNPSEFQLSFCALAVHTAADFTNRVQQRMAAFSVSGIGDTLEQVDD